MKVHLGSFIKMLDEPTSLSQEQLKEFNDIMENEYGKRLEESEVYESASNFLSFYKLAIKQGLLMQFREKLVITINEIKKRANP